MGKLQEEKQEKNLMFLLGSFFVVMVVFSLSFDNLPQLLRPRISVLCTTK